MFPGLAKDGASSVLLNNFREGKLFKRTLKKMFGERVRVLGLQKICDDITKKCKKLNLYIDSKHI